MFVGGLLPVQQLYLCAISAKYRVFKCDVTCHYDTAAEIKPVLFHIGLSLVFKLDGAVLSGPSVMLVKSEEWKKEVIDNLATLTVQQTF